MVNVYCDSSSKDSTCDPAFPKSFPFKSGQILSSNGTRRQMKCYVCYGDTLYKFLIKSKLFPRNMPEFECPNPADLPIPYL